MKNKVSKLQRRIQSFSSHNQKVFSETLDKLVASDEVNVPVEEMGITLEKTEDPDVVLAVDDNTGDVVRLEDVTEDEVKMESMDEDDIDEMYSKKFSNIITNLKKKNFSVSKIFSAVKVFAEAEVQEVGVGDEVAFSIGVLSTVGTVESITDGVAAVALDAKFSHVISVEIPVEYLSVKSKKNPAKTFSRTKKFSISLLGLVKKETGEIQVFNSGTLATREDAEKLLEDLQSDPKSICSDMKIIETPSDGSDNSAETSYIDMLEKKVANKTFSNPRMRKTKKFSYSMIGLRKKSMGEIEVYNTGSFNTKEDAEAEFAKSKETPDVEFIDVKLFESPNDGSDSSEELKYIQEMEKKVSTKTYSASGKVILKTKKFSDDLTVEEGDKVVVTVGSEPVEGVVTEMTSDDITITPLDESLGIKELTVPDEKLDEEATKMMSEDEGEDPEVGEEVMVDVEGEPTPAIVKEIDEDSVTVDPIDESDETIEVDKDDVYEKGDKMFSKRAFSKKKKKAKKMSEDEEEFLPDESLLETILDRGNEDADDELDDEAETENEETEKKSFSNRKFSTTHHSTSDIDRLFS